MNLNGLYKYHLKNGEIVMFKTDMNFEEVNRLPILPNQYKFRKYFNDNGYKLEIYQIIKPSFH